MNHVMYQGGVYEVFGWISTFVTGPSFLVIFLAKQSIGPCNLPKVSSHPLLFAEWCSNKSLYLSRLKLRNDNVFALWLLTPWVNK